MPLQEGPSQEITHNIHRPDTQKGVHLVHVWPAAAVRTYVHHSMCCLQPRSVAVNDMASTHKPCAWPCACASSTHNRQHHHKLWPETQEPQRTTQSCLVYSSTYTQNNAPARRKHPGWGTTARQHPSKSSTACWCVAEDSEGSCNPAARCISLQPLALA